MAVILPTVFIITHQPYLNFHNYLCCAVTA